MHGILIKYDNGFAELIKANTFRLRRIVYAYWHIDQSKTQDSFPHWSRHKITFSKYSLHNYIILEMVSHCKYLHVVFSPVDAYNINQTFVRF